MWLIFSYISIKQKLIIGFGGAILVIIVGASITIFSFLSTEKNIASMVNDVQPVVESANVLNTSLKNAVNSMGFYLLTKEKAHKDSYENYLKKIDEQYAYLTQFPLINTHSEYQKILQDVQKDISHFKSFHKEVVNLTENPMVNIPALRMANQDLNPTSIQMLGLIAQMITSEEEEDYSDERKVLSQLIFNMRYSTTLIISGVRAYVAFKGDSNRSNTLLQLTKVMDLLKEMKTHEDILTLEQAEAVEQMGPLLKQYKAMLDQLFEVHGGEKAYKDHYLVRTEIVPLVYKVEQSLNNLTNSLYKQITTTGNELLKETASNRIFIVIYTMIGTAFGLVISFIIFISISKPLHKVVTAMRDIAEGEGDLTQQLQVQVKSRDEISRLCFGFNTFLRKIHQAIIDVNTAVKSLHSETDNISTLMNENSQNIEGQQAETGKVSNAMLQMLDVNKEMSINTEYASQSAEEASDAAKEGQLIVDKTILSINKLVEQVENATLVIDELGNDVQSISSVADVIRGIAEQTNLLALNAAIEAARAGEAGRGFAVVADEVRMLASKTQESTQEIQETIERLKNASGRATEAMDLSKNQAVETVDAAGEANHTLNSIVTAVGNISDKNKEIALASGKQNKNSEDINANMVNISNIADKTVNSSAEVNQALETLNDVADQLKVLVSVFKI